MLLKKHLTQTILNANPVLKNSLGLYLNFQGLSTHFKIGHQEQNKYIIASAFKAFVATKILLLTEENHKEWSLESCFMLLPNLRVPESIILSTLPDNSFISIKLLLTAMMQYSDNTATEILLYNIFKNNASNTFLKSSQFMGIWLNSIREVYIKAYNLNKNLQINNIPTNHQNKEVNFKFILRHLSKTCATTPKYLVQFYEDLFANKILNNSESNSFLQSLLQLEPQQQGYIFPPFVQCYQKSGYLHVSNFCATALAGVLIGKQSKFFYAFCYNNFTFNNLNIFEYKELIMNIFNYYLDYEDLKN